MDYTAIRQTLESLGEELDAEFGWNTPRNLIEGNGPIGKAVRDCRNDQCVKLLRNALKGWAKEAQASDHPQRKKMCTLFEAAWADFKDAVNEGLEDGPAQKKAGNGNKQVGAPVRLRIQA